MNDKNEFFESAVSPRREERVDLRLNITSPNAKKNKRENSLLPIKYNRPLTRYDKNVNAFMINLIKKSVEKPVV